jgi:hypothetical protein
MSLFGRPSFALLVSTLVVCIAFLDTCRAQQVPSEFEFEQKLLTEAGLLLDKLRSFPEVKSVGVLKFVIKHAGDKEFPASVGTLNLRLAENTEMALVLANPAAENAVKRQIVVIRNATETAHTIPSATHITKDPATRDKLFSKPYPVVWKVNGATEVIPDAFIYGVGEIHHDLKAISLELNAFRRGVPGTIVRDLLPQEVTRKITMPLDSERDLAEMGENFVRPTANNANNTDDAFSQAVRIREKPGTLHPLLDPKTPVLLEVLYDNEVQPFRYFSATETPQPGAKLAEPAEGQIVTFVLRRRNTNDNARYGILLRINGENTLYRERLVDARCSLWVMESNVPAVKIEGYQGRDGTRQPFAVKSGKEALELESFYGNDVGLIGLTVFEESLKEPQFALVDERESQLRIIKELTLPKLPAENRSALGGSLTDALLSQQPRGIIVPANRKEAFVPKVASFQRDETPLFSAAVRYYKPNPLPK